jgi:hypothetical protein
MIIIFWEMIIIIVTAVETSNLTNQIHITETKEVSQMSLHLFTYSSINNAIIIFNYIPLNGTMINE